MFPYADCNMIKRWHQMLHAQGTGSRGTMEREDEAFVGRAKGSIRRRCSVNGCKQQSHYHCLYGAIMISTQRQRAHASNCACYWPYISSSSPALISLLPSLTTHLLFLYLPLSVIFIIFSYFNDCFSCIS